MTNPKQTRRRRSNAAQADLPSRNSEYAGVSIRIPLGTVIVTATIAALEGQAEAEIAETRAKVGAHALSSFDNAVERAREAMWKN